jgi:hypothetical protein
VRISANGGAPTALVARGGCGPIAVDATSVYWADNEPGDNGGGVTSEGATLMKVPVGGGPLTVLASLQHFACRIAVDDTSVYWTQTDGKGQLSIMKLTPK